MTVGDRGRALGMEGEEIGGSADLPGGEVAAGGDVLEETLHEGATVAGRVRPADARRWQGAPHAGNREIMQPVEFFRRALPVDAEIGFVPGLEPPAVDLGRPVTLHEMLRQLEAQFRPALVVAWWPGPAAVERATARAPVVPVGRARRRRAQ